MEPEPVCVIFVDGALDRISLHQPNCPQGQRDSMLQHATLKEVQLQAASTQVENQPRLHLIAQRSEACRTSKPRFFLAAYHFKFNARLPPNTFHQRAIVASFARSGCR